MSNVILESDCGVSDELLVADLKDNGLAIKGGAEVSPSIDDSRVSFIAKVEAQLKDFDVDENNIKSITQNLGIYFDAGVGMNEYNLNDKLHSVLDMAFAQINSQFNSVLGKNTLEYSDEFKQVGKSLSELKLSRR